MKIQACFDEWMTTILDSELKLVPNWNLNIVGLLEEVGSVTRFFFAARPRLALQVKEEDELIGEIENLLEPVVSAQDMEILGIEYRRESAGWVLRIPPRKVSLVAVLSSRSGFRACCEMK